MSENNKFGSRKSVIQFMLWCVFYNGLIASLISTQVLIDVVSKVSPLTIAYLVLQHIGHFQFFSFLAGLPAILLVLIYPDKRFISIIAVVIFVFFISIIVLDYQVYQLYRFHLNGMVWNLISGGAVEEILVFDWSNLFSVLGFLAAIVIVQLLILLLAGNRFKQSSSRSGWVVVSIVLAIQLCGQLIYAWSDAHYDTNLIAMVRYVPHPQALTAKRFLRKRGWAPDIDEAEVVKLKASGEFNYPSHSLVCSSKQKTPNILFIVIDGLRYDMLNDQVMPNWSSLVHKSQVFNNHISTGNATRFGIYGLFSGLSGHYWFDSLHSGRGSVLISELKKRRYQFGFFASAGLKSPEFDKALFAEVAEQIPPTIAGKSVVERDYEITRLTKAFIRKNKSQAFFGFVFFDAPHAYVNPGQDAKFQPALESLNYFKLNNDTEAGPFLNRYKNAVVFNDRLTGEILQTLADENILDNTIVIMTGDHGQEANETKTNSWGHNSNFSKFQVRVPMVIHWPGKQSETFTHLTSHVDIVPTILKQAFACTNPITDYSNGQVIFEQTNRNFVLVKNWNNSAIVTSSITRVFPKFGVPETFATESYRLLDVDKDIREIEIKSLSMISRFYR